MLSGRIWKYQIYQVFLNQVERLERILLNQGKFCVLYLELIDLVKSRVKKSSATLTSLGAMVSIPAAFLEFNPCMRLFISISFTK